MPIINHTPTPNSTIFTPHNAPLFSATLQHPSLLCNSQPATTPPTPHTLHLCYNVQVKRKILSFDLDGTLVDAGYGDIVWNHGIPTEYAKKYDMGFDEAKTLVRTQYESVGDADLLWYDIEYWLRRFELPVSSAELLDRYESHIKTMPYANETLEGLREKYTLVIASNAARVFVEKELTATGLEHYFSKTVSATTDFGLVKKNGDFYGRLCKHLDISPQDMVHVGDHPVFDYDAPAAMGIKAFHITKETDGNNGRKTIDNLGRLLELL